MTAPLASPAPASQRQSQSATERQRASSMPYRPCPNREVSHRSVCVYVSQCESFDEVTIPSNRPLRAGLRYKPETTKTHTPPTSFGYRQTLVGSLHEDALVLVLEPLHSVLLGHTVVEADSPRLDFAACHSVPGPDENNVEIHTENTGGGVVLKAQIDVFRDAEAEAARGGEVLLEQLVLPHLEGSVQDLVGLEAADLWVGGLWG
jgi:hypothetical protein